ncbi:hypothetical protein, partial [Variovorax beijingensis]|uniref:hypothetical protein n=1 Tax=Variovorax beijingensis TaxID=2496117 RepID=UPI001CB97430
TVAGQVVSARALRERHGNMHLMSMPILSSAIVAALRDSSDISRWISTNHPGSIIQTPTSMLAGPSYGSRWSDFRAALTVSLAFR